MTGKDCSDNEPIEKHNQQSLENELLFNQLFVEGLFGIVTIDQHARFLRVNPAFCKITGYSEEELAHLTFKDITHPEHISQDVGNMHKLLRGEIPRYQTTKRYIRKDNEIIWCSLKSNVVRDSNGDFKYILTMIEDITLQQRTEERLRKFRMGIDNTEDAIYLTDADGIIEFINPAFEKMYGYNPSETIGKTPQLLKSGHTSKQYYENLWHNLLNKKTIRGQVVNKTKDGHLILIENSNTPILDDVGSIIGFISINRDVSERKRVEEKIKTLGKAIEQGPSSIIITNANGKIEFVNRKFTEFTQYELKDVIGTSPRIFNPGHLSENDYKLLWETLKKGDTWNGECLNRRKDNTFFWEEISISAIKNEQGAISNYILIKNDISEKKQILKDLIAAKEIAEKNEKHYYSLFENMIAGFAYCQMIYEEDEPSDFIYHLVNSSFEPLTGLKEVTGKKVSEVIPGIQHRDTELFQIYGRVAQTGIPEKFEIYVESLNDWYSISVYSPQKDYFVAVFDVITERKKVEKALIEAKERAEESDRLKSTFLANMSHELRTPLNSIIGFSNFMLDPLFGPDEHVEFARIIQENGNNLLEIISNIMDLSKIEAGQMTVTKNRFSVKQLITEIYADHILKINEKGLVWKESPIHENEIFIYSDENKLRQILSNFFSNAIKFTEAGFIEIGYIQQGNFLQFHVRDTGIGIPLEFHELIFERFRQLELTHTRNYEGNGLGLSISKALVELLEGNIWLESEPGIGSTFYFKVPVAE